MATTEELLDAAVHFEFEDGSDCYQFELRSPGKQGSKMWPPGTILWEARGCNDPDGGSVRWFETQHEALAAIGHPRE